MLQKARAAILLLRPAQWVKNLFLFAALVFGPKRGQTAAIIAAAEAFGIFCLLSGAVYAFNDLLDYREDAHHPTKRNRPVASGRISPGQAGLIAILCAAFGTFVSLRLPPGFAVTAVAFLILNFVYTVWGKHRVLVDVIMIAIGFVIRALAGAQAIDVEVSAWLVVCTFTLCLFLGFGKRRCELAVIDNGVTARSHRATLALYTPDLLNQLLSVTGGGAVITFLLYTLDPTTPSPHSLVFTTPLVFYAVFRYASVIERGERTGPTDVLIKDKPFLVTAIAWTLITLGLIAYGPKIERFLPKLRYPGMPAPEKPADALDPNNLYK
ncbi:MAG TPA: decaprenyl-phosphate phosphoribosyltransferase [Phycisphaerae bacterium]|nr:decaprenyl-phosphate phosphoribosyltransferase [Phycisphaerae bacterium]